MRYKLTIEYDGTSLLGWQRQLDGPSVQQYLEEILAKLNGFHREIVSAGRTDAGVHALGQVAHIDLEREMEPWKIREAFNGNLQAAEVPVSVLAVEAVDANFNARFSAHSKAYVYVINTGDLNPFTCRWSWHIPDLVNPDGMEEALKFVVGTHDFSTFTVELDPSKDHVRTIYKAEMKRFGPLLCIHIMGNGFLYKMVRSIVGAVVEVGRGNLTPDMIGRMLEAKKRSAAKDTAPALGLFLLKVFYDDSWKKHDLTEPPFWVM